MRNHYSNSRDGTHRQEKKKRGAQYRDRIATEGGPLFLRAASRLADALAGKEFSGVGFPA